MKKNDTRLEVLISTLGAAGLRRVARHSHPAVEGVRYIICVQTGTECQPKIPEALRRGDFSIRFLEGKGLSKNRNHLLSLATAPYVLISDDDLDYTAEQLGALAAVIDSHPEVSLFTFQYLSESSSKSYPSEEFDLATPPRGYYPTSFEIAFRLDDINTRGLRFDTRFGLGAEFIAGEEELFVDSVIKAGLKCRYFPLPVCRHDALTTGEREISPEFIRTKAAVIRRLHPRTWGLRMIAHALRNSRHRSGIGFAKYIRFWMNGARKVARDDA